MMEQIADLGKSWTDTMTTLSIGSVSIVVPMISRVDPDGSLSFALGDIKGFSTFLEGFGTVSAIFISLILLSFVLAVGFLVIQFGEFISLWPDKKDGGKRFRKRVEQSSKNSALFLMFANGYSSYRLLCGLGGIMVLSGAGLAWHTAWNLSLQTGLSSLFLVGNGILILLRFARYSFLTVDWVIFGDIVE